MRKKLLAGVMALALCSTNMSPQTIFAGEFTSGNLEEVTEETPEIFTDDNQEVTEETEDELSVFSSESVPEFSNEANVMPATADGTNLIEINLNDTNSSEYKKYYNDHINQLLITSEGSYRFIGSGDNSPTTVPICIGSGISRGINIYLNNVYIVADSVPALDIRSVDDVNIYLENNNFLKTQSSQKDVAALNMAPFSFPTINSQNNSGSLTVSSEQCPGIICTKRLTINGGSVTAYSTSGTGIESDSLTINGGSVDASSQSGTGIENDSLTINGGSVKAFSTSGTGIKSNSLTI